MLSLHCPVQNQPTLEASQNPLATKVALPDHVSWQILLLMEGPPALQEWRRGLPSLDGEAKPQECIYPTLTMCPSLDL